MENEGESAAQWGARPGHSRARAREKAASARVATNGCELARDPGNQAPRFPSIISRILTPHGGRCYSGDLTVLPCKVKTFCKLLESSNRSVLEGGAVISHRCSHVQACFLVNERQLEQCLSTRFLSLRFYFFKWENTDHLQNVQ